MGFLQIKLPLFLNCPLNLIYASQHYPCPNTVELSVVPDGKQMFVTQGYRDGEFATRE